MDYPTFEEAAQLWPRLSDAGLAESERDDSLLNACEEVILRRQISSAADAVIVCQVLLENISLGSRTDDLDRQAVDMLRVWLRGLAAEEGLPLAVLGWRAQG